MFKCSQCLKEYETELEILGCIQRHDNEAEQKNECFVCAKEFPTKAELLGHLPEHGVTIRQCPECLEKYETEDEMYACIEKHEIAACKHSEAWYDTSTDNKKLFIHMRCDDCGYEEMKSLDLEDDIALKDVWEAL